MKQLLELGKTLLIIVLLCTLILLSMAAIPLETIRDNPKLSRYLQPLAPLLGLQEAEIAYVETALPAMDAAQPMVISISNSMGRSTAMWDFEKLDAAFETFGGILGQALDTAELFTATSSSQLQKALSGTSVYFQYQTPLPISLLASWLDAEQTAAVPACSVCVLSVERDVVALYLPGQPIFRAVTQVRPEDLEQLLETAPPDGSQFAFEAESHLDDLTILPASSITADGYAVSNPCDSRYIDQLATDLGFNPYGETRFTADDGSTYFSEGNTTLEITAAGAVELLVSASDRFLAPSTEADALTELARQLVDTVVGDTVSEGRIYLSGFTREDSITTCTFDYIISGIPVSLIGNAATIVFDGPSVSSMEVQVKAFRSTGEVLYPLPVSQAAAILPADSRLTLEYRLGGGGLTVGWRK